MTTKKKYSFGPKFYKNYNEDNTSVKQIIVADNGVFIKTKANPLCFAMRKTTLEECGLNEADLKFDKIGEEPLTLEAKPYMTKKIPKGLMNTILRFYQVYAKKGLEVKVNVWYDKINDEFFLDCPFQQVTSVTAQEYSFAETYINWTDSLKEKYPQKYALAERLANNEIVLVLETHSHHNMGCSFSSTDDKADYFDTSGCNLSGVYITVIKNPRIHLRYFIANTFNKNRMKSSLTKMQDEVLFKEEDIIDFTDTEMREYDFNDFARYVNITDEEILNIDVKENNNG